VARAKEQFLLREKARVRDTGLLRLRKAREKDIGLHLPKAKVHCFRIVSFCFSTTILI
jgi:hypothetical protein